MTEENLFIDVKLQKFLDFCKTLIETYILVLVKYQLLQSHKDSFLNALNVFRVNSEERQNFVKLVNFSPMSAGFSNAGCIIDGSVYLWGRTDVNYAMNRSVLQSGMHQKLTSLDFITDFFSIPYRFNRRRYHANACRFL